MDENKDSYFVSTKSSRLKPNSHDIVTFVNYKPKPKQARKEESSVSETIDDDMKKARFEVYKFAQSGLSSSEKHQSNLDLAVKLGAKPPNKKYQNYKELKIMKEKERIKSKASEDLSKLTERFGIQKKRKSDTKKKKNMGSGILSVYGKATLNRKRK